MEDTTLSQVIKRRAAEYIGKREKISGVPFPFRGAELDLCIMLMAGFAAETVMDQMQQLFSDKQN